MAKAGKRIRALIDSGKFKKTETLSMDDALAVLVGGSGVKFDETVEVALQLGVDTKKSDQTVRGACVLPAGTGKAVRGCGCDIHRRGQTGGVGGRRRESGL